MQPCHEHDCTTGVLHIVTHASHDWDVAAIHLSLLRIFSLMNDEHVKTSERSNLGHQNLKNLMLRHIMGYKTVNNSKGKATAYWSQLAAVSRPVTP